MGEVEFYIFDGELWCKSEDGKNQIVNEFNTELIGSVLGQIMECYPAAYKALSKEYSRSSANVPSYHQILIIRDICATS